MRPGGRPASYAGGQRKALLPRKGRGRLSPEEVETALRAYEVMVILDPSLEERTVAAVARQVPQRRPQGRRQRRERRRLGPSPPRLRDQEERRGHLRRRQAERRAGHRQGARPPARAQRVGAAHQGHPARRSLSPTCGSGRWRLSVPRVTDAPNRHTRSTAHDGDLTWQARPHHRGRQPRRRPGAPLHPLGCRRGQLPDRLDAAHLRPADQRVEGRRRAVPLLLGVAAGRGERRRVADQQGMRVIVQGRLKSRSVRDPRGREAHRLRDRGRRGRPEPEVRHRQGHPRPAARGGGG